jgi:membrane protease YdiL (CAAX protease family)
LPWRGGRPPAPPGGGGGGGAPPPPPPPLRGGLRWHLSSGLEIPLAVGGSLATGYREEIFFRAYLLTRLGQAGLAPWAAVTTTTVLFALGHLYEGPLGVATALGTGVWFCVVFLRTRRLHVVAIAHGLWNAAALALTLVIPVLPTG